MDLEKIFIAPLAQASSAIGDDGVIVEGKVYSTDAFVEGTHFRRDWMSLRQIAYKSLAVNVSDAYAMNAVPRHLLMAIGLPRAMTPAEVRELSQGFADAAKAFRCEIIGGDTIRDNKLSIAITVVSDVTRPLMRSGVRPGDLLAYTGSVGKAAKELRYLLSGRKPHARSHYVKPTLRQAFIAETTPFLRAGMDVSDGIYTDLARMASLNRIGFKFLRPLPKCMGCSGEEYEMLIAFPPRQRRRVEAMAKKHRVRLSIFARAARRAYRNPCKSHHF